MGLPKNHLKVLNELQPERIANAKTLGQEGSIDKGLRKMLLDTKAIKGHSKQWAHDSVNLTTRESGGQQGVLNSLHNHRVKAVPCCLLRKFAKPEVFSSLCYFISKVLNFGMHLPIWP